MTGPIAATVIVAVIAIFTGITAWGNRPKPPSPPDVAARR